jgi:hypothetical protein
MGYFNTEIISETHFDAEGKCSAPQRSGRSDGSWPGSSAPHRRSTHRRRRASPLPTSTHSGTRCLARFSANATFQSHIAIGNLVRQMETTNGAHQFPEMRELPASLLGKDWYENSGMDSAFDPAATANN